MNQNNSRWAEIDPVIAAADALAGAAETITHQRKIPMNKFITTLAVASLAVSASTAYAGGPVVVEEEMEVVAEKPASSAGLLPLLLIPIILCVALCGNDDPETPVVTAVEVQ